MTLLRFWFSSTCSLKEPTEEITGKTCEMGDDVASRALEGSLVGSGPGPGREVLRSIGDEDLF